MVLKFSLQNYINFLKNIFTFADKILFMDQTAQNNLNNWLSQDYDIESKNEIQRLLDENPNEAEDAFYKSLDFGTGGLRGIMGVGTNRMNKYTVGFATQGFANYLKKSFPYQKIYVVVAYDSRNNSKEFAEIVADVFTANKIHCYLFNELRPTPVLSFAIRHLQCKAGVMITASHNPKEYNGYKAYWTDGGQLVPPHDQNVITYVKKINALKKVKWERNPLFFHAIDKEVDEAYFQKLTGTILNSDAIFHRKQFKIVYTPLHGTGITMVPEALQRFGFRQIYLVDEQSTPDGDFPTVKSPNPEEPAAMELAILKAKEVDADLVLGTDPDADRVAVAIKIAHQEYKLLNGNETATLLFHHVLSELNKKKELNNCYTVKTIVTTQLLNAISLDFNVKCYDVLTGFKYIAEKINQLESKAKFVVGGEESFGYLINDYVRDKDSISACCTIAEMAAAAKTQYSNVFKYLLSIYKTYYFPKERLLSITKKGKKGIEEISNMMYRFRFYAPDVINDSPIVIINDYQKQISFDKSKNSYTPIELPVSNVLQFILEDKSIITVRPSGTEPKIKFYFSVRAEMNKFIDYETVNTMLEKRIDGIIHCLELDTNN